MNLKKADLNKALSVAIITATNVHKNQLDKAGQPYILHPLQVMNSVDTIEEKIVAVLHDVIEDGDLSVGNLVDIGIPYELATAVEVLSRAKGTPYMDYVEKIKKVEIARKVKLADLNHNMDRSRLKEFTERDEKRFKKYQKAYEFLTN